MAVIALYISASISHRNAIATMTCREQRIHQALLEIYPEFRDHLMLQFDKIADQNPAYATFRSTYPPADWNSVYFGGGSPYFAEGAGYSHAYGGVLGGPTVSERDVWVQMHNPNADFALEPILRSQLEWKVKIKIEQYVPWYLFAGPVRTTVTDLAGPENAVFLELLQKQLRSARIEYEIRK